MDATNDTIPYGYCHCGCGQLTSISEITFARRGMRKGEPRRYIHGHNLRGADSYTIEKRFWNKVQKNGDDECWNWLGPLIKGYGNLSVNRNKNIRAHRMSYVLAYGDIPDGMLVCHKC